jgi:hypothetical protein
LQRIERRETRRQRNNPPELSLRAAIIDPALQKLKPTASRFTPAKDSK